MYVPEVDDYVIWKTDLGQVHEGWVYFKGEDTPEKRGWPKRENYITIEIGVKPKPKCEYTRREDPHKMIHVLLLCYKPQWKELKYVKRRKSKYDDTEPDVIVDDDASMYHSQEHRYSDPQ